MKIYRHLKEAAHNIVYTKLRALLAILGIVVGTGSVVALMSSSQLATRHALSQFKTLGTNLVSLTIEKPYLPGKKSSHVADLTLDDMPMLQQASPQINTLAPFTSFYGSVYFKGKPLQGITLGVTQDIIQVVKAHIKTGRFISNLDHINYYCVIGDKLSQSIKKQSAQSALGQQLQIGNNIFTIIGVLAPWQQNMFLYNDLNTSVLIPLPLSLLLGQNTTISNILFRLVKNPNINSVQNALKSKLKARLPGYTLNFRNPQQIINIIGKERQTFSLLLILIGAISLVVGAIGIMNIMLVSVLERKREIGIRMAIGAHARDIRRMFLLEAVLLTVSGGGFGMLIGEIVTWSIALASHWYFEVQWFALILSFGVSVAVGILAGIYPAHRAAKLDPIICLRAD